jgi:hypothetical protein
MKVAGRTESFVIRATWILENTASKGRSGIVPKSVLDAIKEGRWDYEPPAVEYTQFDASDAMPGTKEKLSVLAERVLRGLPLWHLADRDDIEAPAAPPRRRKPR